MFTFKHVEGASQRTAKKDGFALFDYFANCEYFEEDFDYDKKLSLPKGPSEEGGGGGIRIDDFTNTSPDSIAEIFREEIGLFGMRIDREMYRERFAEQASPRWLPPVASLTS